MERNLETIILRHETERLAALADKPRRDAEDLRTRGLECMAALDYDRACECFRSGLSLSTKHSDLALVEDLKIRLEGARAAQRVVQERNAPADEHPADVAARGMPTIPLAEARQEQAALAVVSMQDQSREHSDSGVAQVESGNVESKRPAEDFSVGK